MFPAWRSPTGRIFPNGPAHYDTKHHQDKREYVESFIRDLARYKINMLVWEWEDKFEYPSHPEIGAPGAFTMAGDAGDHPVCQEIPCAAGAPGTGTGTCELYPEMAPVQSSAGDTLPPTGSSVP